MIEVKLAESKSVKDADGKDIDLAQHRVAMQQSLGNDFLERCRRDLSVAEIKCGLAAADSAALKSCAHSSN